MFIPVDDKIKILLHTLVNLHLYPDHISRLGQPCNYKFRGADIVRERTGNLYEFGRNAITYRYSIDGPGFAISLFAIWADEDEATADVHIAAIRPHTEDALMAWLHEAVTANALPRDNFHVELR